jgi:hypothetical protein
MKTKPQTREINPYADRFVMCRCCDRLFSANTGYMLPTVPDDSPGILEVGFCEECRPTNAVRDGIRPAALWIAAMFLSMLACHVALLVAMNR